MSTYPFKSIEPKWQKTWEETKAFAAPTPTKDKPAYFILVMFPYPSGHLHMGHVRNYTIGDVLARFYRRNGRSVLHPIGWDAFGLPAENAAVQRKVDPAKWTWDNIAHMRGQLKELGISYDWDREFATCDPAYYKWNQWIFIKMFEKGLVFRKKAPVNWCNTCNTVLANEQVHDGKCWRCKNPVTPKELVQWFFKITDYAEELLTGHNELAPSENRKGWPNEVLAMQKNWIGKSTGAHVDFIPLDENKKKRADRIRVFTTRPDTLFGATFMVLAPEHPMVPSLTTPDRKAAVEAYINKSRAKSNFERTAENREKTGEFTGAYAENPVNGQPVPIWIADYVLTDYGTGAIMAVPAHDERDFAFAKNFNIPIIQVIKPEGENSTAELTEAYTGPGVMTNSGSFDGMPSQDAKKKITDQLESKGLGEPTINYKIRDWLLSRQRSWGTPIPMVYCEKCDVQPAPLSDLPIMLPDNLEFTGEGAPPLAKADDWINTKCPKCGGPARRETDTMDTFVDSSWYYARYTDPKNESEPFSPQAAANWIPVTQYVGGIEHACMHLIYSRFFHKVLRDMDYFKGNEPFGSLLTQGMVTLGGYAMSKSRGNVVDPKTVIDQYGTDSCRLFILFAAPPTQQLEWSDQQLGGIWRFINRVWRLGIALSTDPDAKDVKRSIESSPEKIDAKELTRRIHITIDRVTNDIQNDFGFNTAIAAIMELVNAIYLYPNIDDENGREAVRTVLSLLFPFAPHISEELWIRMGNTNSLSNEPWPIADMSKTVLDEMQIVIQINGKLKDKITVSASAPEEDVRQQALDSLASKGVKINPKRVIYVPKKLVNFVGSAS